MKLTVLNKELVFQEIPLVFVGDTYEDVFTRKNNKSLLETINHKRYEKFRTKVMNDYSTYLYYKLGDFLRELKNNNDLYYKEFLNKNGDKTYSEFVIEDPQVKKSKGLYLYSVNNLVKYIGRCRDSFGKRINQGYGKIHPKNCFIDGQSTNCHLNNLVSINRGSTKFFIYKLTDNKEITTIEEELIKKYKPEWNLTLGSQK
ncbi:hypothetical protein D3C76_118670 [compost metagenome]